MAFTTEDADRLRAAIASGAKQVRYGDGRLVEYQDTGAMLTALAAINAELSAGTAGSPPRMTRVIHTRV
jgi:hypothetical protein